MSATETTATPSPGRPRRRLHLIPRTRKGRVTAAVLLLLGVPAFAYAVYLFLLGITGSVSGNTVAYSWQGPATVNSAPTYVTATSQLNSQTDLQLDVSGAYPGDSVTFSASVGADSGSQDGVVVGIEEPAGMPAGWSVSLGASDCGKSVNTSGSTPVQLVVGMDPGAAPDSGGTWPAGLGLTVVPADQYTPALCP